MTAPLSKQWPLALAGGHKSDVRTQFAALCYQTKGDKVKVLLVTSRGTGRWIIPKGWPIPGATPGEAALTEAWEEAGVRGRVEPRPIGLFSYLKEIDRETGLPCVAMVYAVKVQSLARDFPERDERRRKWVSRKKAASLVDIPELSRLLRDFDPRALR